MTYLKISLGLGSCANGDLESAIIGLGAASRRAGRGSNVLGNTLGSGNGSADDDGRAESC